MKTIVRRAGAILLALSFLGSAAACGGGPDSDTLVVGSYPNSILTFPLAVADGEDMFADEDLKVKFVNGKTGPEIISTLIGGTTQIAAASSGTAIPALKQGQDLKVLPPFERENKVIAVGRDTGITDLKGLVGKTIAVPVRGSEAELFAVEVLKEFGVNPDDVTFVAAGSPATLSATLVNGKADAASVTISSVELMRSNGAEIDVLASSLDGTAGKRGELGLTSFYTTTGDFYKEHPEDVASFCRVLQASIAWIADPSNRDAVISYLEDWIGVNRASAEAIYESEHDSWFLELGEEQWVANTEYAADSDDISFDHVDNDCG